MTLEEAFKIHSMYDEPLGKDKKISQKGKQEKDFPPPMSASLKKEYDAAVAEYKEVLDRLHTS